MLPRAFYEFLNRTENQQSNHQKANLIDALPFEVLVDVGVDFRQNERRLLRREPQLSGDVAGGQRVIASDHRHLKKTR